MIQQRTDRQIRQWCRWCHDEYGPAAEHGQWLPLNPENLAAVERAERDHDWDHHTPQFLKDTLKS